MAFDPQSRHEVWPSVRVGQKRETKSGTKMVVIEWMGGSQTFFEDDVYNAVEQGMTCTIRANFDEGNDRRFYRGFDVANPAEAAPPRRPRAAA